MSLNLDGEGTLVAQTTNNDFIFLEDDDDGEYKVCSDSIDVKVVPVPLIKKNDRECVLVIGKSGSGKSYYCALYIKMYMKMFPEAVVYVFSKIAKDPAIDVLGDRIHRIDLNEWNLEDHGDINLYANSLVLFDDIDQMYEKRKIEELKKLRNAILEEGRKSNIYCVITKHQFPARDEKILNVECRSIVFFPKNNKSEIDSYLSKQLMLKKKNRNVLLAIKSRWVMYVNETPEYCVTDDMVMMVGS